MTLARIDGVIVSTVCHPSMRGFRTVICQPLNESGQDEGVPVLAVDPLGAGMHDRVLFHTDGSATRDCVGDERSPLRNLVCAIVDPKPAAD
ncbi:MAG TPA: EutN/CcmL family microcompartment protein [Opitutaceae bacterium]